MSRLTLRQPPPGQAQIDWADPITKGLALYLLPASQPRQDLARKTPLVYTQGNSTITRRGTDKGQSLVFGGGRTNGSSDPYTGIDISIGKPNLSGPFTIAFYGRPESFTSSFIQITSIFSGYTNAAGYGPVLRWGTDGNAGTSKRLHLFLPLSGGQRNITAPTDSVAGEDIVVLAIWDGTTGSIWVNGVMVASATGSGTVDTRAATRYTIGSDYQNSGGTNAAYGTRQYLGDIYEVAVWERGFTFEEARIYRPYQPLRLPRRPRVSTGWREPGCHGAWGDLGDAPGIHAWRGICRQHRPGRHAPGLAGTDARRWSGIIYRSWRNSAGQPGIRARRRAR